MFCHASSDEQNIKICCMDHTNVQPLVKSTVEVTRSMQWTLYVHSVRIEVDKVSTLPERISDVKRILTYIDSCELCPGNEVDKFTPVLNSNGGDLRDSSGEIIAFQDGKVIRNIRCQYLLDSNSKRSRRCPACAKYHCTLRRSLCRQNKLGSETRCSGL